MLIAASAPRTAHILDNLGFTPVVADISEFEKLEGCVTCLACCCPDGNTGAPGKRGNKVPRLAGHWQ